MNQEQPMDPYKKKQGRNWSKVIFPVLLIVIILVILLKFLLPPAPESLDRAGRDDQNGDASGSDFLKQPVSFNIHSEIPSKNQETRGNFSLRFDTPGHTGHVTDLLFFDQGKTLLSASLDGTIRVWNVAQRNNPVLVSTIRGVLNKVLDYIEFPSLEDSRYFFGRIHALAISNDGTYLATAASSRIRLYNLRRKSMIGVFSHHSGAITDLAFSPDGNSLASASRDGTVKIYDLVRIRDFDKRGIHLENMQLNSVKTLSPDGSPVLEICFSLESLAVVSQNGSIGLYECQNFTQTAGFSDPLLTVTCAGFSHSGKYLLAGTDNRSLILLSPQAKKLQDFSTLADIPRKICFSPDDQQVLISCSNESGGGSLHSFSFPDGREIREFPVKNRPIGAIASAAKEGSVLWAAADNALHEITVWDENGEIYCAFPPGALLVKNVQFSPGGTIGLGIFGNMDEARRFIPVSLCFDAKKLVLRPVSADDRLNGAVQAMDQASVMTTDATRSDLAVLNNLAKIQISQDDEPPRFILSGPLNGDMQYASTFAGKNLLVCGGRDGILLVYDLKGNLVGRLNGSEGDILALAGNSSKPQVVAASSDHAVRMWDLSRLEYEVRRDDSAGDDMPFIISEAAEIMSKLGTFKKDAVALEKEMSRLFLENVEDWHAAGQYLRLLHLARIKAIDPTVSLALFQNNEWLAWLPQGYVALSSPQVMKYFGYQADYLNFNRRENLKFLTFDHLYDKMFRPDLIKLAVTNNEQFKKFLNANKEDDFFYEALVLNPPPEVNILSPVNGQHIDGRAVDVKVKIKDMEGGIGDVRIYHNGKLVYSRGVFRTYQSGTEYKKSSPVEKKHVISSKEFYAEKGDMEKTITVRLVPGKNNISCAAMNYRNTVKSAMVFCEVFSSLPEQKPRLFSLVIGNNNFQNPGINLTFTHFDALGVAEMLRKNGKHYFSDVIVKTMLDPKKGKLQAALTELQAQMDPLDTFIFFVSSHGALLDDRFCIVTADYESGDLNDSNSISGDELMETTMKMPALQQVIILDTCFAGSSSWTFNDLYETRLQTFSLGSGLHILSACSPYEYSAEGYNQHGVFSYYLIKALEGDADYFGNKDGRVSVLEVSNYIREQIKSSPIEFQSQSPMSSEYGKDVILVDRHK
jgi:WD40 repeat protein